MVGSGGDARENMVTLDGEVRIWDNLAELDPLWAVLSDPDRRFGGWDVGEFLATGEAEVTDVLATAAQLGRPRRYGRALDFGAGVGRLTRALAKHFEEAVGVDVSTKMLSLARDINADRGRCTFLVNADPDLRQFGDQSFDLVYSSLVLQHLPSADLAARYVAEFLRVVRPDGIVVFQAPYHVHWRNLLQLRRRLWAMLARTGVRPAFLYGRMALHPIRMTALPREQVQQLAETSGATIAQVTVESIGGAYQTARYCILPAPETPPR